ncbi:MAG: hypothetical protein N2258_03930 [Brevinematales bacterium]|nr:hypothetical protein [Brevinematales bacterium]
MKVKALVLLLFVKLLIAESKDLIFYNEVSAYYVNETLLYNGAKIGLNGISLRYSLPAVVRGFSFSMVQSYGVDYTKTSFSLGVSPFFPLAMMDGALGRFLINSFNPNLGCTGCCLGISGFSIVLLAIYSEIYFQPNFTCINYRDRQEWVFYPEMTFNFTLPLWYFLPEEYVKFPVYFKAGWSTILFKELLSSKIESSSFNAGFSIGF